MTEQEYFDTVNELLSKATPIGAYCLAFAEVIRQATGRIPPRQLMEAFVNCTSIEDGIAVFYTVCDFIRSTSNANS